MILWIIIHCFFCAYCVILYLKGIVLQSYIANNIFINNCKMYNVGNTFFKYQGSFYILFLHVSYQTIVVYTGICISWFSFDLRSSSGQHWKDTNTLGERGYVYFEESPRTGAYSGSSFTGKVIMFPKHTFIWADDI